jgi:hypothetical protein
MCEFQKLSTFNAQRKPPALPIVQKCVWPQTNFGYIALETCMSDYVVG